MFGKIESTKTLYTRLKGGKQERIVVVGLKGSGKSSMLLQMLLSAGLKSVTSKSIAVEHVIESFEFNNVTTMALDIGFPNENHSITHSYIENATGLIFIVDSTDLQKMAVAKEELSRMLNHIQLDKTPLLVLANKQDLPNAMSTEVISGHLNLDNIRIRHLLIHSVSVDHHHGLDTGMDWLVRLLIRIR